MRTFAKMLLSRSCRYVLLAAPMALFLLAAG